MALDSLRDLFLRELADLHGAETLVLHVLPDMAKAASHPALKQALERHRTETENHLVRLERCFTALRLPARGTRCRGMEGLSAEASDMMDEAGPDPVIDAGLIGVAQRIGHYEIAAYSSAIAFAEQLGLPEVTRSLRETLFEEMAADRFLTGLAMDQINETALAAGTRISDS